MDLSSAHLPSFFKSCHEVGFYGEGRHFILTPLSFGGGFLDSFNALTEEDISPKARLTRGVEASEYTTIPQVCLNSFIQ